LYKEKNKFFPTLPIFIGLYGLNTINFSIKKGKFIREYNFEEERFK
jgi:hypothetical protein